MALQNDKRTLKGSTDSNLPIHSCKMTLADTGTLAAGTDTDTLAAEVQVAHSTSAAGQEQVRMVMASFG